MILISHRGNTKGPIDHLENTEVYIEKAKENYFVEIDRAALLLASRRLLYFNKQRADRELSGIRRRKRSHLYEARASFNGHNRR